MSAAEVLADGRFDLLAGNGADDAAALDAVLEEDEKRNALHAECARALHVLVDVDLREADIVPFGGELFEDRRNHAARPAPRRPEIDDERAAPDRRAEVSVGECDRTAVAVTVAHQRRFATAAN